MIIKGLIDEDFTQYKKPSMFIITSSCSFKCDREFGKPICQNSELARSMNIYVTAERLIERYLNNKISKAVVFGGLEPFDTFDELMEFITKFREKSNDDIIIYTGYNRCEIKEKLVQISGIENIYIKFGRYIPDQEQHFDKVLGVMLASDNQYGMKLE